jgi:mannose-6-phosphate isomerase-like protein (cupin superfamily)
VFKADLEKLAEKHVHIRPHGPAEFLVKDFSRVTRLAHSFVWDPGVDGILAGESDSGGGAGERHLDGDEVLYLISGALRLILELEHGADEVVLRAGEAVIVPKGVWHRVVLDEPSRYLYFGGGRTELRN